MPAPEEADVLGVRLRRRSRDQALGRLRELLSDGRAHSVYFVHAGTANRAFENAAYSAVLNRGHLVLNDGVGVKWAVRLRGLRLDDNLVGTDLVPALLGRAFDRPLRLFLLGGRPGIVERAAANLRVWFPEVEVAGFAGGYFSAETERAIAARICHLAPDVVLVGMGSPGQEEFIDRRLGELGCKIAIGVGGLFDHWAGELRRARPWVRRLGLEWLQLLLQQPHKWRRYLLGNPKFLWRIFRLKAPGWAREGIAVAMGLVIALAAAELIVRLARPQILERYPDGLYVASATRQYKLRPHFRGVFRYPEFETRVETNSLGLRESRELLAPRSGVRRVLAIGDSFTMAYSVDDPQTWVRLTETILNRWRAASHEVINAGVPGYSTWQELTYLEDDGLALRPEIVLLGFFVGNDIADNAQPVLPVALEKGRLVSTASREGLLPFAFRLALARHSHLYTLAHHSGGRPSQPSIYSGAAGPGWRATGELLERFAQFSREREFRSIVVLIPERLQVDAAFRRSLGGSVDPASPNRRLRELCRAARLECVDLLESLSGPGLYFPQDGHWNQRGNALAAKAVADYLSHDAP